MILGMRFVGFWYFIIVIITSKSSNTINWLSISSNILILLSVKY